MERFVGLIVAGGVATVAGLWLVTLAAGRPDLSTAGLAAVLAGVVALGYGIASRITLGGSEP